MHKRFIELSDDERTTLAEGQRHPGQHQFRARCQCLLLSAAGHDVPALTQLLGVQRQTIYSWFERWQESGLAGLAHAKGQGRRPILTAADAEQVKAAVRANRQQLKDVTASLRQELDRQFSPLTLKRFLKSVVANGDASATV
jgi:transposase